MDTDFSNHEQISWAFIKWKFETKAMEFLSIHLQKVGLFSWVLWEANWSIRTLSHQQFILKNRLFLSASYLISINVIRLYFTSIIFSFVNFREERKLAERKKSEQKQITFNHWLKMPFILIVFQIYKFGLSLTFHLKRLIINLYPDYNENSLEVYSDSLCVVLLVIP